MITTRMGRAVFAALLGPAVAGAGGCDAPPRAAPAAVLAPEPEPPPPPANPVAPGSRPAAPKPDLTLMTYDPANRTLALYELPDRSSRWMLALPTAPMGVPVDREYQFPPNMDVDLDQTAVFYTVPNNRPSPAVSLREIIESGDLRAQR